MKKVWRYGTFLMVGIGVFLMISSSGFGWSWMLNPTHDIDYFPNFENLDAEVIIHNTNIHLYVLEIHHFTGGNPWDYPIEIDTSGDRCVFHIEFYHTNVWRTSGPDPIPPECIKITNRVSSALSRWDESMNWWSEKDYQRHDLELTTPGSEFYHGCLHLWENEYQYQNGDRYVLEVYIGAWWTDNNDDEHMIGYRYEQLHYIMV